MGLVFYEIFERQLPGWDYHKKKASLPSDFATHALVMPMVDSDPNKRPTATQMEQTLTTMLSKIIYGKEFIFS
jgi:hypothetical protein